MELTDLVAASDIVANKTMFRTSTKNEFWLYEYQPCFNGSETFVDDLTVYSGKVYSSMSKSKSKSK